MEVSSIVKHMEALLHQLATELDAVYINLYGGVCPTESSSSAIRPRRWLIPTCTYGYGVWRPDDAVELVCMTDNSAKIFWDFCAEKLAIPKPRLDVSEKGSIALSSYTGASGSITYRIEQFARKHQTSIRLSYCPIPSNFDLGQILQCEVAQLPGLTSSDVHVLDHYRKICDLRHVQCFFGPSSPTRHFTDHYESCRAWAIASGILSPSLGLYLNSEALFWLIFPHYTEIVGKGTSGDEEPMPIDKTLKAISTAHKSFSNIRSVTGRYTQERTLTTNENKAIHEALSRATNETTDGQLLVLACETLDLFLARFKYHARLDASFWGYSTQHKWDFNSRRLQTFVQKAAQEVAVWPLPIAHDHTSRTYAVGFNQHNEFSAVAAEHTGESTLELTIVDAKRLRMMHIKVIYMVLQSSGTLPPSDDDIVSTEVDDTSYGKADGRRRTAKEVLSDLRHNPRYTGIEYEVGYRDRFEGIKWMALEEWGNKPVEDDEFIPLTRIHMFRRKADEQVVWERGVRPSDGSDAMEDR